MCLLLTLSPYVNPTAQLEAKQAEVRRSVKAELEVRGAQEGHLGFDSAAGGGLGGLGAGGLALGLGSGDYADEDRGPGGRPKRRR
jgi:hypothetical protein